MSIPVLTYRNLHLSNGAMVFIMAIDVGANYDGSNLGIAHLTEHVLLGFDRFQREKELKSYEIVGKTGFETTIFILTTPDDKAYVDACFRILSSIVNGTYLRKFGYDTIKDDVIQEIIAAQKSDKKKFYMKLFKNLYGDSNTLLNFPIGTIESVQTISYKDICNFWNRTYKVAPYRITVMSEIDKDFIQEKYNMHFKKNYYSSKHSHISFPPCHKVHTWDFNDGIGIYVKLDRINFYNKTLEERAIEDMACILIEEFMPQYIYNETVVHCHKFRYSKYEQFLSIELYIKDEFVKERFLCVDKKEWLNKCAEFIISSCNEETFKFLRDEYINYINQYEPTVKEQIRDMTNSMIYGDALFDNGIYIKNLQQIKKDDLYKKLLNWFTIT